MAPGLAAKMAAKMAAAASLALLLALALAARGVDAYHYGDAVPTLRRTQYRQYRSEWGEMLARESPHFGVDRTVKVSPVSTAKIYDSTEELKISFSFDHDRFLTPWITVTDGRGSYLHYVEFDFFYSGDTVHQLKWKLDYQGAELHGVKPEFIFIRYHWHQQSSVDPALGMTALLIFSTAVVWLSAVLVILGLDRVKKSAFKVA
jgi:hypothetical protein